MSQVTTDPTVAARASPNVSPNAFLGFESVAANQWIEGCGLGAKCENRGQRPQLQWRLCRVAGGFVSGVFLGFESVD